MESPSQNRGMWPTTLSRRLGIAHPIIVAPMAAGPSTPELVAAGSEAGALGSFGGGYLAPEEIRAAIRAIRERTRRPFELNLFVPEPGAAPPGEEELRAAAAALEPIGRELGIAPRPRLAPPTDFLGQLAVVKEERVPVFSFTFGALPPQEVEASGVDAVVAQGGEAGGHRGTFAGPPEGALIGTMALVPQVVDAVKIPVVAAGGIMDGRGVVAALALGAAAVQLGTAFLACPESGASALHKREVLTPRVSDPTRLTRAYSGKLVRGFATRFMVDVERAGAILPYPHQNALTGELRQAATRQGRADLASMWAGQGVPLARARPAGELVRELVAEAERVAARLSRT